MTAVTTKDPIALLRDYEYRARTIARGLPQQVEVKATWLAIGFRIGDVRLVTPVDEVGEILDYPPLSRVPGTKSWVRGLANVRGTLLPIMDLKEYLSKQPIRINPRSRVLVINFGAVTAGLLVDEVLGLKHFLEEEKTRKLPQVDDFMKSYLTGAYVQDGMEWGVFGMHALARSPLFLQVAV